MEILYCIWKLCYHNYWVHLAEVFIPVLQSFLFSNTLELAYVNALDHLNFHTLCTRRSHLEAPFIISIYNGFRACPSLLETVNIRAPSRNFRHFPLFTVGSSRKTCPSVRCASAENNPIVCKDYDIFSKNLVMLKHNLK
jgi:hypothetical protein